MSRCLFITHPEVQIEPGVPVTQWRLSANGAHRMGGFAISPAVQTITAIFSSTETKAVEAAAILGQARRVAPQADAALGENDRSATGYLPPAEFETMANAFFARPQDSVRGWESAAAAQARIVSAVTRLLAGHRSGDVAIVSHGAVGTLLLCHLSGWIIDRRHDQPSQGHVFIFDIASRHVIQGWTRLEDVGGRAPTSVNW